MRPRPLVRYNWGCAAKRMMQPMTTHITPQPITINSGDLRLEGFLHMPPPSDVSDDRGAPGVVVCHPHPRQGGNMRSSVVIGVADALVASGFAVMRFNFRGVGESEGAFSWGSGETDDADAALDTLSLTEGVNGSRIGIAGYSFGAAVALQCAKDSPLPQAVAAIACPSRYLQTFSGQELLQPKLFVQGDDDHNFPAGQFRFLTRRYADPKQTELVRGADHFFRGQEREVGRIASDFFTEWLRR